MILLGRVRIGAPQSPMHGINYLILQAKQRIIIIVLK